MALMGTGAYWERISNKKAVLLLIRPHSRDAEAQRALISTWSFIELNSKYHTNNHQQLREQEFLID